MRIIAGELRGRRIQAPKGSVTRPTTDRVRESLFSSLTSLAGPDLGGGAVLDAFAGSGALALEALSRGASRATLIERDRTVLRTLQDNVSSLGLASRTALVSGDLFALDTRLQGGPFALILLDPPYTLDAGRVSDWLSRISGAGLVAQGALVSWEHSSANVVEWPDGFVAVTQKRYGTTTIDVARFGGEAGEK